jgi:hypothetical protein
LKKKLAKNPIVPVINEKATEMRSIVIKYISPEENLVILSELKK